MINVKKVLSKQPHKSGYVVIKAIVDGCDMGCDDFESTWAETLTGQYIGTEKIARFLCDEKGINPEYIAPDSKVCSIGFCEKEQKWFGWSHRAIYGFGVGSTVKKGDCAYVADTPEGLIDSHSDFFADISKESADKHRAECQILPNRSGIRILHSPMVIPIATSVQDIVDGDIDEMEMVDIAKNAWSIKKCGKGEWTAKTLADAKQMAIDFANGVS